MYRLVIYNIMILNTLRHERRYGLCIEFRYVDGYTEYVFPCSSMAAKEFAAMLPLCIPATAGRTTRRIQEVELKRGGTPIL